jgi:perosamine synthetase
LKSSRDLILVSMTKSGSSLIPVNEPVLGPKDLEFVTDCVKSGWISSAGKYIDEFEQRWAEFCGRRYGVAVSNGTVALQLAVSALDLKPGDEVVMPSFTIISCALAVIYAGATPVLVDSDPRTWCMDVGAFEDKITPRTRAVMPVHIYGHPVDMDPILAIADKHGLAVIEDAAEAHGAEYLSQRGTDRARWLRCGSLGSLSCFSFYANKPITTGEGGMVLTDDSTLAGVSRSLRNLCFEPERRFLHSALGFNFRMTNIQAALGVAQIDRVDEIIKRKRWLGHEYSSRLQNQPGLQLAIEEPWAHSVYWMFALVLEDETEMDAEEFARRLKERGVDSRPFFLGMHEQPALRRLGLFEGEHYPVAERIARQGLYLPSGLGLTDAQMSEVCNAVQDALG